MELKSNSSVKWSYFRKSNFSYQRFNNKERPKHHQCCLEPRNPSYTTSKEILSESSFLQRSNFVEKNKEFKNYRSETVYCVINILLKLDDIWIFVITYILFYLKQNKIALSETRSLTYYTEYPVIILETRNRGLGESNKKYLSKKRLDKRFLIFELHPFKK